MTTFTSLHISRSFKNCNTDMRTKHNISSCTCVFGASSANELFSLRYFNLELLYELIVSLFGYNWKHMRHD